MTSEPKNISRQYIIIIAVSILCILLVNLHPWLGSNMIADEIYHQRQIEMFQEGDFAQQPDLTTLPGYHWGIYLLMIPIGATGLNPLRIAGSLLGLAAVFLFDICYRTLHGSPHPQRTLQFFLLPILFPWFFLLYTDAFAITVLLLAAYFWLRERHVWAAGAGAALFYVRQPVVVFVFILALIDLLEYVRANRQTLSLNVLGRWFLRGWPYLLLLVGCAGFFLINGGFAVGDTDSHPGGVVGWDNVTFSAWMAFLFIWPLVIGRFGDGLQLLLHKHGSLGRILGFIGVVIAFASVFFFDPTHPYNALAGTLHNGFILWANSIGFGRLWLAIPIVLLSLALTQIHFKSTTHYVIYFGWLISLIPFWLVEPRYSIPAFAVWLLFVPPLDDLAESRLSLNFAALSMILFSGMLLGVLFP